MFKWANRDQGPKFVTLYDSNITLNKGASVHFNSAYSVMLGLDEAGRRLAIRPLNKTEFERGDIPKEKMYRISIRSSYSRISNKTFMRDLGQFLALDFEHQKMFKFYCEWSESDKALIVDFNRPEEARNGH
jgi:hypothetical protein